MANNGSVHATVAGAGAIVADSRGKLTAFAATGPAGSAFIIRDGGASGTIIAAAPIGTAGGVALAFPVGNEPEFETDLHATVAGSPTRLDVWYKGTSPGG